MAKKTLTLAAVVLAVACAAQPPARGTLPVAQANAIPTLEVSTAGEPRCDAVLLAAEWNYPTPFTIDLQPPSEHSFGDCSIHLRLEDDFRLRFSDRHPLPVELMVQWFNGVPSSSADLVSAMECGSDQHCSLVGDDGTMSIGTPPSAASKGTVWAMWFIPAERDSTAVTVNAYWGFSIHWG